MTRRGHRPRQCYDQVMSRVGQNLVSEGGPLLLETKDRKTPQTELATKQPRHQPGPSSTTKEEVRRMQGTLDRPRTILCPIGQAPAIRPAELSDFTTA